MSIFSGAKKFLLFLLSSSIGIGLFVWILKMVSWREVEKIFYSFSSRESLIILFLTLLIWLAGFWKWQFVLGSQGCDCSKKSLLQIIFASNAITYLFTPTAIFGGEGFRIYALRKKSSVSLEKNIAAIIIEKLLGASVVWIFLVTGLLSFLFLNQSLSGQLAIISAAVIGGLGLGLLIFYTQCFRKKSILKLIFRFFGKEFKNGYLTENIEKEIFSFFEFKKKIMWKGLGIAFLKYFLIFFKCWLLIFFLKGELNVLTAMSAMFFLYLAYSFPSPAGVGSLDVAQAFVFGSLGLGAATGITFSFILRGAEIIISLVGIVFLIKLGIEIFSDNIKNFFKKALENKNNEH